MSMRKGPKSKTPFNSAKPAWVDVDLSSYDPPDYLAGVARDEYIRVVRILYDAGSLHKTDKRLIEVYAINYDLILQAYKAVTEQGPTVESDRGNISEHPLVQTINSCTIRLKAIINDLGFTPSTWRNATGSIAQETRSTEPVAKLIKMAE